MSAPPSGSSRTAADGRRRVRRRRSGSRKGFDPRRGLARLWQAWLLDYRFDDGREPGLLSTVLGGLLLVLLVLALSVSWLWPRPAPVMVPGYVIWPFLFNHADGFFQATWILCLIAIITALVGGGAVQIIKSLLVFAPLGVVALVASAFAASPGDAFTFTGYWLLISGAAAAVSVLCDVRRLLPILAIFMMFVTVASVLVSFTLVQVGGDVRQSGLFEQKQVAGWFYVLTSLAVISLDAPWFYRLAGAGVCLLASWRANSVSAQLLCIVMPVSFWGWLSFVRGLHRPVTQSSALFVTPLAGLSLVGVVGLPMLTPLVHRDPTLETRTLAWPDYYGYVAHRLLTGLGPGMFSGSWINFKVFSTDKSYYFSTHNTYLTVLGEVGLFGLAAYCLILVYQMGARPFVYRNGYAILAGGAAFQLLTAGAIEPTIGFFPTQIALSAFVLVLGSAKAGRGGDGHVERPSRRVVAPKP